MLRMLLVKPWVVITAESVLCNTCDNKSLKETVVSVMSLPPDEIAWLFARSESPMHH